MPFAIRLTCTLALLTCAVVLTGCFEESKAKPDRHHSEEKAGKAVHAPRIMHAIATIQPAKNQSLHGTITFTDQGDKVIIHARVGGLKPNGTHAIHIHEFGDASAADFSSAGGHYNPYGHSHGLPGDEPIHAGDLGNLKADGAGYAELHLTVDNITIDGIYNPVIGRSVIIHASADGGRDHQPSGDAGPRIGCGIIGVAQH